MGMTTQHARVIAAGMLVLSFIVALCIFMWLGFQVGDWLAAHDG